MDDEQPKSILDKVSAYNEARKKWVKAGKPLRSKKDILDIYENTCKPCEHFEGNSCGLCGCRLSTDRTSFNKIAMATEECPIGKWLATEKEPEAALGEKRNGRERGGSCGCGGSK
jgi:hypothetical protein